MKNLPIGIQSFEKLRNKDCLYVDKTKIIHEIILSGDIYFLSRPCRFRKSLLISTLDALFCGCKELFEGLYIYDKWDWSKSNPVIRIDWTAVKHGTPEEIETDLSDFLQEIATVNGITLNRSYASSRFRELITQLHLKTGEKVVILIDEYDAPILVLADSEIFDSFDPGHIENIPLLFQTGYLTVKSRELIHGIPRYTLGVPNREVRDSLMKYIVSAYSRFPLSQLAVLTRKMSEQLAVPDAEGFAQSIRTMLENIPYNIRVGNEKYYHSLFLSWMNVLGFKAQGEVLTGHGHIDAVMEQTGTVVVCELKYHSKTKTATLLRRAIKQIHDKNYYGKYLDKGKKIVPLSLAFSGKDVGCRMDAMEN
ncbi:MAG: ATP-binding protein [Tannerella sp.]|jgi:hypothetical protein|nr:ATP-binding protein [Tannerella sp.]